MPEGFDSYTFHVFRYDSMNGAEARFDSYEVKYETGMTVLDALLSIQDKQDGSLSLRCSCRSGVCGSCGMVINGKLDLACHVQLTSLEGREITIEPLPNLEVLKDLVVDMEPFWRAYRNLEPWLQISDNPPAKEMLQSIKDRKKIDQCVNCILCACCYGACPVLGRDPDFSGPAALAILFRFLADSRDQRSDSFMEKVNSENGIWGCDTVLECIKACPRNVRPTDAIEAIRRRFVWYRLKRLFSLKRE